MSNELDNTHQLIHVCIYIQLFSFGFGMTRRKTDCMMSNELDNAHHPIHSRLYLHSTLLFWS